MWGARLQWWGRGGGGNGEWMKSSASFTGLCSWAFRLFRRQYKSSTHSCLEVHQERAHLFLREGFHQGGVPSGEGVPSPEGTLPSVPSPAVVCPDVPSPVVSSSGVPFLAWPLAGSPLPVWHLPMCPHMMCLLLCVLVLGRLTSDERTMAILKMLLNNAVAAKGPAIKGHLSLIPLEATPPPFILTQIDLALQVPYSRRETVHSCHYGASLKGGDSTLS